MEQDSSKESTESQDLERFKQSEFIKPLENTDSMFLLKCPKCGGVHFRHAGYVHTMIPYVDPKQGPLVAAEPKPVQVCVNCKTSVFYAENRFHDISSHIDLQAWDKTEKEAHKATGPGGQC